MIDVSELMDDPDFVSPDPVTVIRRASSVDAHGMHVLTPTTIPITAIVQNGSGDILENNPQAAVYSEYIRVWSRFEFQAQSEDGDADLVTFRGKRYRVMPRDFWANWGEGYTRVLAGLVGVSA
jgi:hypothetical protein